MIEILSIQFSHTPSDGRTSTALAVRKNGTVDALIPEWQAGVTRTAEDSVAAYAISDAAQRQVTIRVRLHSTEQQVRSAFVRAIDAAPPVTRRGCLAIVRWFLGSPLDLDGANLNVLGQPQEREVLFGADGDSDPVEFTLTGTRFDLGVVAGTTTWQWQYRLASTDDWTNFGEPTAHTIYEILSRPTLPWVTAPGTDESSRHSVLWTDVLEQVCSWARGQTTLAGAAGALTEQLFALGDAGILTYERIRGEPRFLGPARDFQLQRFLDVLSRPGAERPQEVNCDDCACALVTFSNALGCNLWVGTIGTPEQFYLNPVRAIGVSEWNRVIGELNWLDYHTVAMTGEATVFDAVFDGMLQLNRNSDPAISPYRPMLAKNLNFGDVDSIGMGTYRQRLARRDRRSQLNCEPRPELKRRPAIWSPP